VHLILTTHIRGHNFLGFVFLACLSLLYYVAYYKYNFSVRTATNQPLDGR
jgi:hypothetical protein